MTKNIHETEGIKRRSVVKAAAWAAPVVAVAVAAPVAAASGEPTIEATYVYLGGDSGAPHQFWANANAQGRTEQGGELVPGYLPTGTTITLTPSPAGAVIELRNLVGITASAPDANGIVTLTVINDVAQVTWQHRLSEAGTISGSTSLTGSGNWSFI